MEFLTEAKAKKAWFVGYNNVSFDGQIVEYLLENHQFLVDADAITGYIYDRAQYLIELSNNKQFSPFSENKLSIKQLDLMKLNHYDSPVMKTSLKYLEFSMDFENIEEMPIHHTAIISTMEEIETIISYCKNDVLATYTFYLKCIPQIKLRWELSKEYGLNLYNASEPRISKELFLKFLSEKLNINKWELKGMRTHRDQIVLKDLIPEYIQFETPEFKSVLNHFNNGVIKDANEKYNYFLDVHNHTLSYGLGGIHSKIKKASVVTEDDTYIIVDSDIKSMYPNIIINNNLAPAHLPTKDFNDLYKSLYERRIALPKSDPNNYVLKICLNSLYGLTKDANSFVYDPQTTVATCIIGQLSLSMFIEMLIKKIPETYIIQCNTDGITSRIPRDKKDLYFELVEKWEKITNLQFEHSYYKSCITPDVNNYLYTYTNGKTKCKGRFVFNNLPYHKDKSYMVVPKAIYEYFVNGVSPRAYLEKNHDILDYCCGAKLKSPWFFEEHNIIKGELSIKKHQKLLRYYVSNNGSKLVKCHPDGRKIQAEAGRWLQTPMNQLIEKEWKEYNVDIKYYLDKIYNEINNIKPEVTRLGTQLSLF